MKRRDFLKLGLTGLTAVALDSVTGLPPIFQRTEVLAANVTLNLTVGAHFHEMINGRRVYSWAYKTPAGPPTIPGPVIFAKEGDLLNISVKNALDEPHGFAIPGTAPGTFLVNSGPILPGQTGVVAFPAPPPGTYLYLDPENAPVNRVLGLHGVLVVLPLAGNNPYGAKATPNVAALFNDLGNAAAGFPGVGWSAANAMQNKIWVFSEIDPAWNRAAQLLPPGQILDPVAFSQNFVPLFYTINGRSGFFSANSIDCMLEGMAGEPILIRNVHAGMDIHSPHIHANHGFILSVNGVIGKPDPWAGKDNVWWVDTWTMQPLNRKDVLYPMMRPPDIPPETWAKQLAGTSQEGFNTGNQSHPPNGGFPIAFPMHSHQETSQSCNGGNYPLGMITHIEFLGALPGV